VFNLILDSIAVFAAFRIKTFSPVLHQIALVLFFVGSFLETVSETQRMLFKADAKNKGKPYFGGLFAYAVHINYFGYTLWRIGFAFISLCLKKWLICCCFVTGLFLLAESYMGIVPVVYLVWDFFNNAMPDKESYCKKNYGAAYSSYLNRTARFVPYLY
jgi:steroid 5-alpha reductase family enzyme